MANSIKQQIGFSLIVLLFFILGLVTTAFAQEGPGMNMTPEERAAAVTTHQAEQLQLTMEQEDTIYQLNLAFMDKMEAVRSNGRSLETMKEIKKLRKEHRTHMEEVLDADQFERFKQMGEEMRAKMKEHRKHNKAKGKSGQIPDPN